MDIYRRLPNSGLTEKLDDLQKVGLVAYDNRRFENNTTYVKLTEMGSAVARKLQDADQIMSSEI